ncbi:hypothetical protein B8V81_0095 [Paenibacillus pasadenensis]|uniref:Uncharacterized protein n=1 Tax=Paenibacillus pasadenensis TaxID=217090 RepID=A0A2N5NCB4_9BACL|nr:hypothetical protein B8V81_0095 [Paenibacillus pasadenensis]
MRPRRHVHASPAPKRKKAALPEVEELLARNEARIAVEDDGCRFVLTA